MNIEWLPVAEGNFRRGRIGWSIDCIVIHIVGGRTGSLDSAAHWFNNPGADVSAHYGVGKDGRKVQWLAEHDTAYHAGLKVRPTAAIVIEREGVNPNLYSIGIECEGIEQEAMPSTQFDALCALVADIATRCRFPLDRRHVIGHREIRANKACPGKINVDDVVSYAKLIAERAKQQRQQPEQPTDYDSNVDEIVDGVADVVEAVAPKCSIFTRFARAVAGFFWR